VGRALRRARRLGGRHALVSPHATGRRALKVALCFGTYPPQRNGGSDFVACLAAALGSHGVEPHVVTSADGEPATTEEDGVVVHRIVRDWSLRGERATVDRTLREAGVDVLHVFFPDSVLQGRYRLPAALSLKLGLRRMPLVATWWNLGLGRRSPTAVRLESLALLARARVLTSHDPAYLRLLRRFAVRRPVEWLPAGNNLGAPAAEVDRAAAKRAVGLEDGPLWLGYFGQLDPTRGVEDLFESLALARRERDVRLVMIGSAGRPERYDLEPASAAYLRATLERPAALGIEDAVRWTEYLPDAEVLRHLGAIDVCVLPYRRNSIGRSALAAALATATPTVLAGTPDGIAPLRGGEDVVLVPPRNPAALAAAVLALAGDDHERARLSTAAREAARLFSWDAIAERALAIYERATRSRTSAT
jgi:glycosyltransferase involved in cell wall biosynthesis